MQARVNPQNLIRLADIIGRKATKRAAAAVGLLPISRTTFYDMIRRGKAPKPQKIGAASVWSAADIIALVERVKSGTFNA